MKELVETAEEFMASGKDNLKMRRFNAAVSDFFKAIVILCDYLLYREIKILPKNHTERFSLLKNYFPQIYREVSRLFETHTKSYNFKLDEKAAREVEDYATKLLAQIGPR